MSLDDHLDDSRANRFCKRRPEKTHISATRHQSTPSTAISPVHKRENPFLFQHFSPLRVETKTQLINWLRKPTRRCSRGRLDHRENEQTLATPPFLLLCETARKKKERPAKKKKIKSGKATVQTGNMCSDCWTIRGKEKNSAKFQGRTHYLSCSCVHIIRLYFRLAFY